MSTRVSAPRTAVRTVLRILVAAGLAVNSYVHFHVASNYAPNVATISQATVFRIEASVCAVVALLVLLTAHKAVTALALLVSAGTLAAVLLYRYQDLGAIGPLPDMYEPVWYTEKTLSAIAEGAAAVFALVALLLPRRTTTETVVEE